mmetsp:Transcript_21487/g.61364  ORF Transcript_21487/g.61364 Transcript_21487/m.61364 type:complete len:210 (+) Transcript_21487:117-746(+)
MDRISWSMSTSNDNFFAGCNWYDVLSTYSIELVVSSMKESRRSSVLPNSFWISSARKSLLGRLQQYDSTRRLRDFSSSPNAASILMRSFSIFNNSNNFSSADDGMCCNFCCCCMCANSVLDFSNSFSRTLIVSGSFGLKVSTFFPSCTSFFQTCSSTSSSSATPPALLLVAFIVSPLLMSMLRCSDWRFLLLWTMRATFCSCWWMASFR